MEWNQYKALIKEQKQANLQASEDVFEEAVTLAYANHCVLRRKPGNAHFQLLCLNENSEYFIYNLYPSTQRIYSDPKHRGPFLQVKKPWTLLDVVKAKIGERI